VSHICLPLADLAFHISQSWCAASVFARTPMFAPTKVLPLAILTVIVLVGKRQHKGVSLRSPEMTVKKMLLLAFSSLLFTSAFGFAQNVEITGYGGGQVNGGLDLSTTAFRRLEVGNSANYGVILGYLVGDHLGVEFQWNRNQADTTAQPLLGGSDVKLFSLNSNQYMGNFLFHLTPKEARFRPFGFFGLGANNLSADRAHVDSTTKFAWALGAGAKFNMGKHFGLRGQIRWAPTYITTTSDGGVWCDPFWGGCWASGDTHYLHEFDTTGGITFRF
jgi:opacity protein-like surface antigen